MISQINSSLTSIPISDEEIDGMIAHFISVTDGVDRIMAAGELVAHPNVDLYDLEEVFVETNGIQEQKILQDAMLKRARNQPDEIQTLFFLFRNTSESERSGVLVRILELHPSLELLLSLAEGRPSQNPFPESQQKLAEAIGSFYHLELVKEFDRLVCQVKDFARRDPMSDIACDEESSYEALCFLAEVLCQNRSVTLDELEMLYRNCPEEYEAHTILAETFEVRMKDEQRQIMEYLFNI